MRLPVVWVLKAKMKWVIALKIIAQAKMIVMPMLERNGMRIAQSPAKINRKLRAIDQLIALGASAERGMGSLLMSS